ncbi:unnamed protein product [Hymenolepis diminuta]|uniref:DUF1330 domain-containing protein n=1 Tax=Hymenolepis diminuta TaxID=6216 RepID=A0A0R3SBQ9_HYMDI|nr:unnamed protein product [Hymenolepis diminuta]VUZ44919.1 unnamed protein product [Hymenolepis diminuta]
MSNDFNWHNVQPRLPEFRKVPAEIIYRRVGALPQYGSCPDDRYFAMDETDGRQYFLFESKNDFIGYYLNKYFSRENISTDPEIRFSFIEHGGMLLSQIPHYKAFYWIDADYEDVKAAVPMKCAELETFQREPYGTFVRRKDGFIGIEEIPQNGLKRLGSV